MDEETYGTKIWHDGKPVFLDYSNPWRDHFRALETIEAAKRTPVAPFVPRKFPAGTMVEMEYLPKGSKKTKLSTASVDISTLRGTDTVTGDNVTLYLDWQTGNYTNY